MNCYRTASQAQALKLSKVLRTTYPFSFEIDEQTPYINILCLYLCDILEIIANKDKINLLIKFKISELTTKAGNIKVIINTIESKLIVLFKESEKWHIKCEYNFFNCYHVNANYHLYTRSNNTMISNIIEKDLLDAFEFYDLKYIFSGSNCYKYDIYNYEAPKYYYYDEEEQEEILNERREQELNKYDIKLSTEQHIILRNKIINKLNLDKILTYVFDDDYNDLKHIKYDMYNYCIPYRRDKESRVIELMNITKGILRNQLYYGCYDNIREDSPNDWSDEFIRKNRLFNFFESKIDDEDEEEKIKGFNKFVEIKGLEQEPTTERNIYYSSTAESSFLKLFNLVSYYLAEVKEEYDQSPHECIILSLIIFHYDLLETYFKIYKTLINGENIYNATDYKIFINHFGKYENIIENSFLHFKNDPLFNHNEEITRKELLRKREKTQRREKLYNILCPFLSCKNPKYTYRGLLIVEDTGDILRVIYRKSKRVDDNERLNIVNQVSLLLQAHGFNIFFDRY